MRQVRERPGRKCRRGARPRTDAMLHAARYIEMHPIYAERPREREMQDFDMSFTRGYLESALEDAPNEWDETFLTPVFERLAQVVEGENGVEMWSILRWKVYDKVR